MGKVVRRFLLRFLILAVFLNTAVALPTHQASHVDDALAHATEIVALAEESGDHAGHAHHNAAAEAQCAWCLGYASLHTAVTCAIDCLTFPPAAKPAAPMPASLVVLAPRPSGWHYSAQAPPKPH